MSRASKVSSAAHGLVKFGDGDERWSVTDVTYGRLKWAAWKCRNNPEGLTQTECFHLAGAVESLHYLLIGTTTEDAIDMLRAARRHYRETVRVEDDE
jgi:hypothetical protein